MEHYVIYNYEKHYDFIKSDEAKDIFLNLEKEKYLKESEQYHYEEEDLKRYFSYDEEKKSIVESFMRICRIAQMNIRFSRENEEALSEHNFNKFKSNLIERLSSKNYLDPEYIYEHWQVEKLRFFDDMDLFCEYGDSEECSYDEFIFDSL